LTHQNEKIRQEAEAREAAAKKKEAAEKEKAKVEAQLAEETSESPPSPHPPVETSATTPSTDGTTSTETTKADSGEAMEEEHKSEEEHTLTAEEMDAISQLITDDPVQKERAELERLKAAMKGDKQSEESADKSGEEESSATVSAAETEVKAVEPETTTVVSSPEPMWSDEADKFAKESLEKADKKAAKEADASTTITLDDHTEKEADGKDSTTEEEDPIVARLKKRVESMVDKLEVQLSETKIKIGDKLHYLDKDGDGVLNKEEMAEALQQVLKRKISFEEAMEIADEMDENQDGVFTVEELIRWIDEHKLVKFVEEDRDADMDSIMMESQASNHQKEEEAPSASDTSAQK